MQPRYPRQGDQADRYTRQLQTQHDVDIKRLWGALRSALNPYSGPSDISLPANPTTSTTTADPPCCASYQCVDVFIPDILDFDGETVLVGGWFRLTGDLNTCQFLYNNTEAPDFHPYGITLDRNPSAYGHYEFSLRVTGYAASLVGCEWKLGTSLDCPGPNTQTTGHLLQYGATIADPDEPRTATASATLVSCSDPTSTTTTTTTTTTSTTTADPTTTTTTSTTTPGDLPTTTTTTTSTTTSGGGGGTSTTTAADCTGYVCQWEWTLAGWTRLADCTGQPSGGGSCFCDNGSGGELVTPPRSGYYLGELYTVGCAYV